MEQIRCIIVDDEPGNIVTLQELIKTYCPQLSIEGTAENPVTAEVLILKVNPQLVFLDVEMPFGNAFTLLDKIQPVSFQVVFVTAFNEYAIKAIKYSALDYLLKPINIQELKVAVDKAINAIDAKNINSRVTSLLENLNSSRDVNVQTIGFPTKDGLKFSTFEKVMFMEAKGNYTIVYLVGEQVELVSRSLNYFDDILPRSLFCRVHHSYLVNINFIKKYYKGRGGHLEMTNGSLIEISTRRKDEFFNRFVH